MRCLGGMGGVAFPRRQAPPGGVEDAGEGNTPGEYQRSRSPQRQHRCLGVLSPLGFAASASVSGCRFAKWLTACHIGRFQVCRQPHPFAAGVPGNSARLPQVGCG